MCTAREREQPTAQRIVAAATELFSEKGFHATTTREIAEAVGMRGASLYHHFPAKEDILYEIALQTMAELLAGGRAAVASAADPEGKLRRLVEWHVRYSAEWRLKAKVADDQLHALSPARRAEVVRVRDEYEQLFRAILTEGRDHHGWHVDDVAVATFALATMASAVGAWFRETGRLSADAVASIYGDIALRAVGYLPTVSAGPARIRRARDKAGRPPERRAAGPARVAAER